MTEAACSPCPRSWWKRPSIRVASVVAGVLVAFALIVTGSRPPGISYGAFLPQLAAANVIGVVGAIILAKPGLLVTSGLLVAGLVRTLDRRTTPSQPTTSNASRGVQA